MATDLLQLKLRHELEQSIRRSVYWQRHHAANSLNSYRRRLANQVAAAREAAAAEMIRAMGYQVYGTTYNCPFDLWVADASGRAARVEVKTSLYHQTPKGGRYQSNLRKNDQADLLIFLLKNGVYWPFVIPTHIIGQRRHIAIWSACPGDHTGQWQPYLRAWQHLEQIIQNTQSRTWQLSLPGLLL